MISRTFPVRRFALLCLLVVRRVTGTLTPSHARSASPGGAWIPLSTRPILVPETTTPRRPGGRDPPLLLAT